MVVTLDEFSAQSGFLVELMESFANIRNFVVTNVAYKTEKNDSDAQDDDGRWQNLHASPWQAVKFLTRSLFNLLLRS